MTPLRKPSPDELLASTAGPQRGVFNLCQALAAGLDNAAIHYRVSVGRLKRELPGVLLIPGAPWSWERDVMAAIVWAGPDSAASGRAAARVWGFSGFHGAPVEISTTAKKNGRGPLLPSGNRVVVHRVDHHLAAEIVTVGNVPVTSARRTILDLAGMGHPRSESVLDAAFRLSLTNLGLMWRYLEQEWMRGRRGVRRARDMLIARTPGQAPTDSDLELIARDLIDQHGLPSPESQFTVMLPSGPARIDLTYPDLLLAIEIDSYAWHMDRKAFELDRRRDNELAAMGWTVLRLTWAMLTFEPDYCIALIKKHLN